MFNGVACTRSKSTQEKKGLHFAGSWYNTNIGVLMYRCTKIFKTNYTRRNPEIDS